METHTNKALIVLTNVDTLQRGGTATTTVDPNTHRTGFDIHEVAYMIELLCKKKRVHIEFATPRGGEAPIDPFTLKMAQNDEVVQDLLKDRAVMTKFKETRKLDEVNPTEFKWVLFPGCHGAMLDLPQANAVNKIASKVYENHGWICAIGHGTAALLAIKQGNEYLVKNKKITCSTNEEEKEHNFDRVLPFSLEDRLREIGARIEKREPFKPNVVVDERIITGQNTYSIREFMKKLTEEAFRD